MTDLQTKLEPVILFINAVGFICNAVSFNFFVKRRRELGIALLAYMNIVDMLVTIALFLTTIAPKFHDPVIAIVLNTISFHIVRISLTVTGLLTIYLNILRTFAIVWPMHMVRIKRRLVMASLIALITIFVSVETAIGVLYTYPKFFYIDRLSTGAEASPPFTEDHPFVKFVNIEFQVFGFPIIFIVIVCCTVSAVKLLLPNKTLQESEGSGARIYAAMTVLILGVVYVVLNTIGLTLITLCVYSTQRSETYQINLLLLGTTALIINSAANPIVYICRVKKLREYLVDIAKCYCLKKRSSRTVRARDLVELTVVSAHAAASETAAASASEC